MNLDLFDIYAKLTLDTKDYEEKAKETAEGAKSFGSKIASGLGNAAKVAAKVGAKAVAAGGAAIVAVGKQAVSAYAEYEQLVGGVETLFKDSSATLQQYAAEAYKTAGLSANQYMDQAISMSSSLIQSLGGDTEKAADYVDMAIRDMSDNVNKMGSSMEAVQNAYRGLSMGNYTMLDNLKLGYKGTQSEMERLILDAESLDSTFQATRDANGDLTMSYADIVDAIHIVQDEMGITGTTAKEASTTIQGSIASAKAAYQNWVTGLADENADIEQLTNQLYESIETVASNLLPVVERVLESLGKTLKTKLPQLVQRGISYVLQNLPKILALGLQLVKAVIQGLGQGFEILFSMIGSWLQENLIDPAKQKVRDMIDAGKDAIAKLIEGIKSKFSELVTNGRNAIAKVKEGLNAAIGSISDIGQKVVDKIKEGISSAWSGLTEWFNDLWDKLFGDRDVNVNVNTDGASHKSGGFAIGIDNVPYNGFPATLHRGEAVLTAREADEWRRGNANSGESHITVNVYTQRGQSNVEIASEVEKVLIRWDRQRKAAGVA